jgi:hypothetical protein
VRYLQGWNFGRRLGRHGVFANSSFNAPGLHGLSDVSGNRALPRVLEFSNAEALSSVPTLSRTAPSSVRQRTVEFDDQHFRSSGPSFIVRFCLTVLSILQNTSSLGRKA